MLKRTPLFPVHQALGARLVDFGGWEMPVQYSGIVSEHLAVRSKVGVFDISHMGEVIVRGKGASAFLDYLLTNRASKLGPGEAQYSLMCRPEGGVIDDLYVYCVEPEVYMLIINASRIDVDALWIEEQLQQSSARMGVEIENCSNQYGAIALQGPLAAGVMDEIVASGFQSYVGATCPSKLKKNQVGFGTALAGHQDKIFIARTGYTGEDGFEIVAGGDALADLWYGLMKAGAKAGIQPAGLGARDTLRTEMCYPLYGHELDEKTTPLEAGLRVFVDFSKPEFIGKKALADQQEHGLQRRLVAFRMSERSAPPRAQYSICHPDMDNPVGVVTSGTQSPSMGVGIGLGYVPVDMAKAGVALEIDIRGRRAPAVIVAKPIYRRAEIT